MNNRIENVRTLIDAGVDLSHQDTMGETPTICAASINNYRMVYLFINKGANISIKDRVGYDLARMIKRYGNRAMEPGGEDYKWYLIVVGELKKRGLLDSTFDPNAKKPDYP